MDAGTRFTRVDRAGKFDGYILSLPRDLLLLYLKMHFAVLATFFAGLVNAASVVQPNGQPDTTTDKIVKLVILTRHGDRTPSYKDPVTSAQKKAGLTLLGATQEVELGNFARELYLEPGNTQVVGANDTFTSAEITATGSQGEGEVVLLSGSAFLSGFYPPNTNLSSQLGNGTVVTIPQNGFQFVPLLTQPAETDLTLNGWVECPNLDRATQGFFASSDFQQIAAQNQDFLNSFGPISLGQATNLTNVWNLFDIINFQATYNSTVTNLLNDQQRSQLRALANYEEYTKYTGPAPTTNIESIGGATFLAGVLTALQTGTPITYYSGAYVLQMSAIGMLGVPDNNPDYPLAANLKGIVDFGSMMVFELRNSSTGGQYVRFGFRNGTTDAFSTAIAGNNTSDPAYNSSTGAYETAPLTYLRILNQSSIDVPLDTFTSMISQMMVNDTQTWCDRCGNTESRGCQYILRTAVPSSNSGGVSPVGAGFIGMAVTLVVAALVAGLITALGYLSWGKTSRHNGDFKMSNL